MNMTNFERYNQLHDEIIKRLKNEELTIETAKSACNLIFDKYIMEAQLSNTERDVVNEPSKTRMLELFNSETGRLIKIIGERNGNMPKEYSEKLKELRRRFDDLYEKIEKSTATDVTKFKIECDKLHDDAKKLDNKIQFQLKFNHVI